VVKLAASFVALPAERRSLAFAQTAARMAASSVMVEKDFLGLLAARPAVRRSRIGASPRVQGRHVAIEGLRRHRSLLGGHRPVHVAGVHWRRRVGVRGDDQPHEVRAWVVEDFPAAFGDWQCKVTALELPRTFWEKATILHAEHHRPEDQPTPERYARHYADMARLLLHADASAMLSDHALCERVVAWKSRVFSRQWARYDIAKPGTFRLLPPPVRRAALARDYAQMRAMFLSAPPTFEVILDTLDEAERQLNAR
jgi:hypothetical protein